MMATQESIPVFVSSEEKARIEELARKAGLSTSEYLRSLVLPTPGKTTIRALLDHFILSANRTCDHIDETVAFVEASNKRMAEKEAKRHWRSQSASWPPD
ncbi:hypothetical protein [Massilia sp. erpn]|uniref:plasmid mobilization protein n=1 Tax=Massilia sp. erpn TaxID=2738142 RepID=UPI0021064138|nr:hypothetical protein [Massilia sp. erpn]UTY57695.1 ribbon-helix-helix protein, CopG family [Massilia sp. erpn]